MCNGLHILHLALLLLKVECLAQDAQEMGTSLHILQACIMYAKGRRNSTLYFVQLCVRKRRPDSLYKFRFIHCEGHRCSAIQPLSVELQFALGY